MPEAEKPYSKLVAQAESAVADVKDVELRRVAFEKVLDDLLTAGMKGHAHHASGKSDVHPEKRVPTIKAKSKRGGPQANLDELVSDRFFAKPKTISEVKAELENRGHHIPLTSLSGPLQKLCQKRALRRQRTERTAKTKGTKRPFAYSNW
jgi:hypothetical protein